LKDHLDLSRFKKRDDISDEQFDFLVTARRRKSAISLRPTVISRRSCALT